MNSIKLGAAALLSIFAFSAAPAGAQNEVATDPAAPVTLEEVVTAYADLARAAYDDTVRTAKELRDAIELLLAEPNEDNLDAARTAWKVARIPFMQTNILRFGEFADNAWEKRVNAWPVDEGFLDYVDAAYLAEESDNPFYAANVIASPRIEIDGQSIELTRFNQDALIALQQAASSGNNVATGYHAIEFLLWGQDDNSAVEITGNEDFETGGQRLASDFAKGDDCTNANCGRRAEYLFSAVNLLVSDLEEMSANWQVTGISRDTLLGDPEAALVSMLSSMASLSYGEIAGDQLERALILGDSEAEEDDFSDYSYAANLFSARGVVNAYFGEYFAMDNSITSGASLAQYVAQSDAALDEEMRIKFSVTMVRLRLIVTRARTTQNFDQMILEGNEAGNGVIRAAVDSLVDQTRSIEKMASVLGLGTLDFQGSDSLDNPGAVN